MKQLLATLWNFVRMIPKGISKYIHRKNTDIDHALPQIPPSQTHRPKDKRKRRSFQSFLHEEQSASNPQIKKSRHRRQRRRAAPAKEEASGFSSLISDPDFSSVCPSQQMLAKEHFLMKMGEAECEAIFQDTNGVEISMINEGKINEDCECKESDSEIELIKLISGDRHIDHVKPITQKLQQKGFQDAFRKKEKLKWWQKIVEGKSSSFITKRESDEMEDRNDKQASNLANSLSSIKISNKKIIQNPRQTSKRTKIKVLNLIDLVRDQDFPQLYHVPLSVKVYD